MVLRRYLIVGSLDPEGGDVPTGVHDTISRRGSLLGRKAF